MWINQIRYAIRIFLKDRFFSVLNLLGLALGIATSIILLLVLQNDLTYDQHHLKYNRIYRLGAHEQGTGVDFYAARSARELGPILKEEFPEVEEVVRAEPWNHVLVKYRPGAADEKSFYEENIVLTDSTFFHVFTHRFLAGNPATCLRNPESVVITASTAARYFGQDNPLERTLIIDGLEKQVTGVIEDVPANSHLRFDLLLGGMDIRPWIVENGQPKSEAFWNPDVYMYLLFPEAYSTENFFAKFPAIFDKYFKSFGDQVGGKYTPILEPLADIHFHSRLEADEPQGNLSYLYAFTAIGMFIILLACINYMNLSTAKSVSRATEVAMKKALGSDKWKLVSSFLVESVLLSLASLLLAVGLVYIVLMTTSFNQLVDRALVPDFIHNRTLLFGAVGIAVGIGILSGLYPAFYLPNIPTLQALKGAFKRQSGSHALRKVLITVQFAISIFVVVCTLFMQEQIEFVQNKSLGFNKDNIVVLPIQDTVVSRQLGAISQVMLQHPHIKGATSSYNVMGMNMGGSSVMWAESETGMKQQAFTIMTVGDDYLKVMGIELVAGRDFQTGPEADTRDVFMVNEAGARLMGWTDNPIGKKIKFYHGTSDGQIIGVVKDFNYLSLHNEVAPLIILKARQPGGWLHLKVEGENLPETMSYIREKWMQYNPNYPYEYFFLDQRFNDQYKTDEVQHKLLSGLSYICIFISLLGLLGLSAFTATQRTREIGIRKVHGANVPSIIYLLYKDVMLLVLLATLLIIPIGYYVIHQWLGNFAYQMSINYFIFALVGCLALLLSFLTVAFHSLKTASANPVESLKYE